MKWGWRTSRRWRAARRRPSIRLDAPETPRAAASPARPCPRPPPSCARASARSPPRRPYDTQAYADDSDDDFVGPASGSAAVVVIDKSGGRGGGRCRRARPPRCARGRPGGPAGAASASAARLSAMARSPEADTSSSPAAVAEPQRGHYELLLQHHGRGFRGATEADANAPRSRRRAPSTLPGSSSSGDAEAEMRASLAATMRHDVGHAGGGGRRGQLAAAARRAAVCPPARSTSGRRTSRTSPAVEVPVLRPLDAILGALGEQVRARTPPPPRRARAARVRARAPLPGRPPAAAPPPSF